MEIRQRNKNEWVGEPLIHAPIMVEVAHSLYATPEFLGEVVGAYKVYERLRGMALESVTNYLPVAPDIFVMYRCLTTNRGKKHSILPVEADYEGQNALRSGYTSPGYEWLTIHHAPVREEFFDRHKRAPVIIDDSLTLYNRAVLKATQERWIQVAAELSANSVFEESR